MNSSKIFLLVSLLLPSVGLANAKVIGNGGNVVVCKDGGGKITSVETLDLFEGRAIYSLSYTEDTTPALQQSLRYTDKMSYAGSPVSAKNLSADTVNLYKNLHFLPSGVGLKPILDSGHFIVPKGCRIVQTVNYQDWENIFVDRDIWDLLSETQRAALLLHEVVYAYYREGNFEMGVEETSTRARLVVASLFAGKNVEAVDAIIDNKLQTYLHCQSKSPFSEFFYYQNSKGKYVAQFRYYFNRVVFTRTWLESNTQRLISGVLNSPFESGVHLQISFTTEKSGSIYDLDASGISSSNFSCSEFSSR